MKTVTEVTSLSSKGQIVLPKKIRTLMELEPGTKFVITSDGNNILLKPIEVPELEEFDGIVEDTDNNENAERDIAEAIRKVRKRNHEDSCEWRKGKR